MRARIESGLFYLARGNFVKAQEKFEDIHKAYFEGNHVHHVNILYYLAVARLGALLARLSKEVKAENKSHLAVRKLLLEKRNNPEEECCTRFFKKILAATKMHKVEVKEAAQTTYGIKLKETAQKSYEVKLKEAARKSPEVKHKEAAQKSSEVKYKEAAQKSSEVKYKEAEQKTHEVNLKETAPTLPDPAVTATAEELQKILSEFELAKKLMRPKVMGGIEFAINHFIKNLFAINQCELTQRARCFSIELLKFQLLYSTKLSMTEELKGVGGEYYFALLIPKPIKKLRNIITINKEDPLFLSYNDINQLYPLLQEYRYNKKYNEIYAHLEEHILLTRHILANKQYLPILRKYHKNLKMENVILLHVIYNDFALKDLRMIIEELHNANLLSEKIIDSFARMIRSTETICEHLKQITDVISSSDLTNKNKLLVQLLQYALGKVPHQQFTDYQIGEYISYVKASCITREGKVDLEKLYLFLDLLAVLDTRLDEGIALKQICDLMKETEMAIGSRNFIALVEKILKYKILPCDFIVLLNLGLQFSKESAAHFLRLMDEHCADNEKLKNTLNDFLIKEYQRKYPERPLEEVMHDFLTPSNEVEFPLDHTELKELEQRYKQIKNIGEKLMMSGRQGLLLELNRCKILLDRDPENETARLTLLAIIRLQIRNSLGIYPYNLQMLNVLALLNQPKRIAQIKTGEGKSTLIAILAAYHSLLNRAVDIVTTSHDLAIRDVEKFSAFYRALGLKVNYLGEQQGCERDAILYGTVSDFEFAYLRGETQDEGNDRGGRPFDVVIADEVDSMFIDMQRNQSILSNFQDPTYKADVYEKVWNWINETKEKEQTKENLQAMLKEQGTEITTELAKTWLKSARTAQLFTEEKEYIIDYPESKSKNNTKKESDRIIKIVNKSHTGEVQGETTHWQGGLHQFLEVKHKLQVHIESLTTASISHIDYFNKYKTLLGLTGTLGSKASRDELDQLYKVKTYDSPPYKPSMKKPVIHLIESDERAQMKAIKKIVKQQVKAGRPVLILCESIQESKNLDHYLMKSIESTQLYNGIQTLSADALLALAGNPGVVTIATNLAGRGTDIVTTPEAELHGGLHVIMTFPAINQRVEQQAFGRTGRQGKMGSYQYILRDSQLLDSEKIGKTTDEKMSLIQKNREIGEKLISLDNLYNYNVMHKVFVLQSIFFALPMQMKLHHKMEWATFKTETNKYAIQYMRDELEEADEYGVMSRIINKFNDFWKSTFAKYGDGYKTPIDFIKARFKKYFPDEHAKKLLLEALALFENPKIDFSSEITDSWIEYKSPEWLSNQVAPHAESGLTHFQVEEEPMPVVTLTEKQNIFSGLLSKLKLQ